MKRVCLIMICCLCLCGSACATDLIDPDALQEPLSQEAAELLQGIDPASADLSAGVDQILSESVEASGSYLKSALSVTAQLLAVTVLCSIAGSMEHTKLPRLVGIAGALAVCAIGITSLRSLGISGEDTISQLQSYCDTLLPALAMATASCGGITTASSLYVGTMLFVDILIRLIRVLLQPLVYVYLALACAGAVIGEKRMERLQELVVWLISTSLKTVLFIFSAYLTITGAVSGSADSTTVKAAKLTLSGVVPVVGSMISDASETLVVSASLLRNSIGIFGMLAVLAICALPFLQALIRYLILKAGAALSGIFDTAGTSSVIGALSTATGFLLAMTGSCALMLVISFVCYIRVVIG